MADSKIRPKKYYPSDETKELLQEASPLKKLEAERNRLLRLYREQVEKQKLQMEIERLRENLPFWKRWFK